MALESIRRTDHLSMGSDRYGQIYKPAVHFQGGTASAPSHRFLRDARAAASARHPSVATLFHLGRTGDNYFYAMDSKMVPSRL
jgi:hypothetical protein